jgi:hypothetical protein
MNDVRHPRQRCQAIGMEDLVTREVRHVESACDMVRLQHFWEQDDGLLEGLNLAALVTLQPHCREHRERLRAIAANDSALFKFALSALTTRWRQAYRLSQFEAGRPRIVL